MLPVSETEAPENRRSKRLNPTQQKAWPMATMPNWSLIPLATCNTKFQEAVNFVTETSTIETIKPYSHLVNSSQQAQSAPQTTMTLIWSNSPTTMYIPSPTILSTNTEKFKDDSTIGDVWQTDMGKNFEQTSQGNKKTGTERTNPTVYLGSRNKSTWAHFSLLKRSSDQKKSNRVSHKDFNSLWTDIGQKENCQ